MLYHIRLQNTLYGSVSCQAADLKDQAAKAKFWLPFEIFWSVLLVLPNEIQSLIIHTPSKPGHARTNTYYRLVK